MDMSAPAYNHVIEKVRNHAVALTDRAADYTPLLQMIDDAHFVLIGEATHGTDEFYRIRAELTKQLILYHGFAAVAVEGDWPDAYRINRYVRGDPAINNADSALAEFTRFPTWMWRNEVVAEFIDWLREYNQSKIPTAKKAGFYGLDLYSLNASMHAVIDYLDKVDPPAAKRARHHYGCFDHIMHTNDPQGYGYAVDLGIRRSCENDVVQQLAALRQRAFDYTQHDGVVAQEAFFYAEQNAKLAVDAEEYYRAMFQSRISSWNLRDRHMAETLEALAAHLGNQRGEPAKIVVWAHNSHVGDARATEMGQQGEFNIGQLMRERHGNDAVLIGFSTYGGAVTAASEWDGPAERKTVRPALAESYEALLHDTGMKNFLLPLRGNLELTKYLHLNRLQRAIGVLYLPRTELQSHYFYACLPQQFDAVIHIDTTQALRALEPDALWHHGEVYEAYPTGL
jgi:erythromycin esterase-like protein